MDGKTKSLILTLTLFLNSGPCGGIPQVPQISTLMSVCQIDC